MVVVQVEDGLEVEVEYGSDSLCTSIETETVVFGCQFGLGSE